MAKLGPVTRSVSVGGHQVGWAVEKVMGWTFEPHDPAQWEGRIAGQWDRLVDLAHDVAEAADR